MRLMMTAALCAVMSAPAFAQQTLEFEGMNWRVDAVELAETTEFLGRDALHFRDGVIWIDGSQLATGEIRFEMAISGSPGHTGVLWRGQGVGDWEKFYFRHHLNNLPDSVQYTPAHDGVTAWQVFSDPDAISQVNHGLNRWMEVRVVVAEDQADIFMDGQLIHHVPDLQREERSGWVGFWQLAPSGAASGYVRNVEITPQSNPQIIGRSERPMAEPVAHRAETWRVSDPFSEDRLGDTPFETLRASRSRWTALPVAYNDIANLASVTRHSQGDTVLAEATLIADGDRTALVRFGYSDRVQVFLNGERLFVGNNDWRSRDYRYLGTITRHVAVPLSLRDGENTLTFAVSETFGGWGVTAALEDADGVRIAR
ncbi:hypothetical protein [Oceanicaulis sp. HTCC2633]|uniref:hypothetical protein n=1 Tax=Oceanicaulis sp. HTCC2633 TaxID=314254 RepID=UPI00032555C2|nr:hypothetical protein [Oceanicaulis sp. HTCC2633]